MLSMTARRGLICWAHMVSAVIAGCPDCSAVRRKAILMCGMVGLEGVFQDDGEAERAFPRRHYGLRFKSACGLPKPPPSSSGTPGDIQSIQCFANACDATLGPSGLPTPRPHRVPRADPHAPVILPHVRRLGIAAKSKEPARNPVPEVGEVPDVRIIILEDAVADFLQVLQDRVVWTSLAQRPNHFLNPVRGVGKCVRCGVIRWFII